ncbi:MAG TPA: DUF6504 family protein [Limnochorda sp.]
MRRVVTPIALTLPREAPLEPGASPPGAVPAVLPLPGSTFRWRGRRYVIEAILDSWQEAGCWWEGEPVTEGFHVAFRGGGTGILLYRRPQGPWVLDRIDD